MYVMKNSFFSHFHPYRHFLYHENDEDNLDVYFAGPFAMSLNLEKIDEFSKYTFLYTWTSDPTDSNNEKLTAVFDTPGSRINRRSSLGTDTELSLQKSPFL